MIHTDLWRAIDKLAERNGLSTSELAKLAGLNENTFNQSKRIAPNGRLRWPSFEKIDKALQATNTSMLDFLRMACDKE